MLTSKQWGTIDEYLKLGIPITEIARHTGVSKPTIYKRVKENKQGVHTKEEIRIKKEREINKYESHIKRALKQGASARVIHTILKENGCAFSYDTTNRYIKELKDSKKKQYKSSIKRDTAPGEEAQVDWGHYGKILVDGRVRRISFFVYVLGYSRCMYVEFTINQVRKTLKQCHLNAFQKLGIPQKIMYDNMTTVRNEKIKVKHGKKYKPVPEFLDFARCLGFEVVLCAPNHPRSKGKVENTVKFVKKNFLQRFRYYHKKGEITLELLSQEVQKWLVEQHERIHEETHEKPSVLWNEEKQYLHFPDVVKLGPLLAPMVTRKVSKDGYIFYNNLPPFQLQEEYKEEWVNIKEINEHGITYVEVYFKNKKIARYVLSNEKQHENLLAKEKEVKKRIRNGKVKKRRSLLKKKQSFIPNGGFYRPDGYYDKYTSYRTVLWGKK